MTEIRCKKCDRLLMTAEGLNSGAAEIKCSKCKYLNRFWFGHGFDPKGIDPDKEYVFDDLIR